MQALGAILGLRERLGQLGKGPGQEQGDSTITGTKECKRMPETIDAVMGLRQICGGYAAERLRDQADCGPDDANAARAAATPVNHRLPS